jgi:hypothetical protein
LNQEEADILRGTLDLNVRANFGVEGREYRKYGTNWGVQFVVIDKTGPPPGGNWRGQLSHIVWGQAKTLEEVWPALCGIAREPTPSTVTAPTREGKKMARRCLCLMCLRA